MANENFILLFSTQANDEKFAREVARAAGCTLVTAQTAVDTAQLMDQHHPAIVLVDIQNQVQYQAFEEAIQEKIGLYSDKIGANAIHFLSTLNLEEVPYLIQSPLFGSFILRNFTDPVLAGQHYGKIVRSTLVEKAFGLAGLLNPGARTQTIKVATSTNKIEIVEAIKNYAIAAKFQSRMATVISYAVDELIMNAIFDAPVDELGRPTLATTSRNTPIRLTGKNEVEVQIGFDGQHIGITAIDLYGSLDKSKLLGHISKIYTDEEYRIKHSVAGAGIGLATVFRSGGSFFFASETRTRTEVTVLFQNATNYRAFRDQFKFISTHFYF